MSEKNQTNSVSGDTAKTTSPSVVVSHFAPHGRSKLIKFVGRNKKPVIAIVFVIALIGSVLGWNIYQATVTEKFSNDSDGYTISHEEYGRLRSATLTQNPPAAEASKEEKSLYYSELISEQYNAHDFRAVANSYKKALTDLGDEPVLYSSHLLAAQAYIEIRDKGSANKALSSAKAAVAKLPDDSEMKHDQMNMFTEIEAEINKL